MTRPFLVVGLPRSRTAWLARFLTFGDRICRHEPSLRWTSRTDFLCWVGGTEGASDSMMTWLAQEAKALRPDLPVVVIRRPLQQALASVRRLGYGPAEYLPWYHEHMDHRLDRIEDETDCLSYPFADLTYPTVCASIFRHCLGERMPLEWWDRWHGENVQADIAETMRLVRSNVAGWQAVYGPRHMLAP